MSNASTLAARITAIPTFRALRHRNFRLFFIGQACSMIGTWTQQIAMMWLVYRLSGSPFLLGLTGFAGQICMLVVAPIAGIWCDRLDRHRMLKVTQVLMLAQALTLTLLSALGAVQVWHIVLLAFALGLFNAFDMPARQSFFVHLLEERKDLPNAIALNAMLMNAARLTGPAIAGLLIVRFGETICFALNALSYLAILVALALIRVGDTSSRAVRPVWASFTEGLRYAFAPGPIRSHLLLVAGVSLLIQPYVSLMPIFAAEVFHGGAGVQGMLISCAGIGAVAGTLYLATRKQVQTLSRLIAHAALSAGVGLLLFSLTSEVMLAGAMMVLVGFGMIVTAASVNTLLQSITDEDKRGRIVSLYAAAFIGMAPVGSLVTGQIAQLIGAPRAFFLNGVLCIALAAVFFWRLPRTMAKLEPMLARASAGKR